MGAILTHRADPVRAVTIHINSTRGWGQTFVRIVPVSPKVSSVIREFLPPTAEHQVAIFLPATHSRLPSGSAALNGRLGCASHSAHSFVVHRSISRAMHSRWWLASITPFVTIALASLRRSSKPLSVTVGETVSAKDNSWCADLGVPANDVCKKRLPSTGRAFSHAKAPMPSNTVRAPSQLASRTHTEFLGPGTGPARSPRRTVGWPQRSALRRCCSRDTRSQR